MREWYLEEHAGKGLEVALVSEDAMDEDGGGRWFAG